MARLSRRRRHLPPRQRPQKPRRAREPEVRAWAAQVAGELGVFLSWPVPPEAPLELHDAFVELGAAHRFAEALAAGRFPLTPRTVTKFVELLKDAKAAWDRWGDLLEAAEARGVRLPGDDRLYVVRRFGGFGDEAA